MSFLYKTALCITFLSMPLAFAYANTSVSIQSLSPSNTVLYGTTVSFTVNASGFTNPTYSVSDSFGGSSVSPSDINSSGNFSWIPSSGDVGTHNLSLTVTDASGNSDTLQEQIVVTNVQSTVSAPAAIAIQGLSPGTSVVVGNPLTFIAAATSFVNPSFTVSDSFSGSSISNADISSGGAFSWTPTPSEVGTHTITVYASDSLGHSANVTEQILVEEPNIAVTSINPGNNVNPGTTLTFALTQAGLVNPSYTLSDAFSNTSISNSNINASGNFAWTPTVSQVGSHPLTIYATDSEGHIASTTIELYVIQTVQVALTAPSPSSTVAPGTTVVFNASAYGFTNPSFTVGDGFAGSSITNANINSAGSFSWTPTAQDVGTHVITVSASDTYSHLSSAQTTITVAGTPVQSSTPAQTTSSTASSGYQFTTYLSPGSTGADVTALQNILISEGYLSAGSATGYYGSLTEAGVVAFQAAHDIDQLGVVGPATRAALNALGGSSAASASTSASSTGDGYVFSTFLGVGSSGDDVTELQKRLTTLDLYSGPITGYYGSLTEAAVEAFQGQHGIAQVGYVGPGTRAALNN